eukprot:TRINITY_DN340_c0_g1_i2.p1 TRINITY_DN340_c0_g1~~TRINITY_DN340_c0_g1_i2.p1  ORF type:complete len:346 (+),score=88.89 TRINITY_DN340_c0_g1_i2:260-1297(+)
MDNTSIVQDDVLAPPDLESISDSCLSPLTVDSVECLDPVITLKKMKYSWFVSRSDSIKEAILKAVREDVSEAMKVDSSQVVVDDVRIGSVKVFLKFVPSENQSVEELLSIFHSSTPIPLCRTHTLVNKLLQSDPTSIDNLENDMNTLLGEAEKLLESKQLVQIKRKQEVKYEEVGIQVGCETTPKEAQTDSLPVSINPAEGIATEGETINPSFGEVVPEGTLAGEKAVIDPKTGSVIRNPIPVRIHPTTKEIIPEGEKTVLNPIIRKLRTVTIDPSSGEVMPEGTVVGEKAVIDPKTGSMIRNPTPVRIHPTTGEVLPEGENAVVNPITGEVIRNPKTGFEPHHW